MTSRYSNPGMKRRASRHDAIYPCHMVREHDDEVISRVALDVSAGGMLVLTGSRVLTGEPVHVTFRAPESGRWLTVRGTVARVLHGRRPNDLGRRLGVEFHDLTSRDRARLVEASLLMERPSATL